MRISILIFTLLFAVEVAAQERPQEPPQQPQELWSGVTDVLKKFIPTEQPLERPMEQPLDAGVPGESPEAQRQVEWDAATKLVAYEPSDTDAAPQSTTTATSHTKEECLDPAKFQPGLVGYLDYYLFTIVDTGKKEVYLEGEQSEEPFCLTNVDAEDLEEQDQVVITGNVAVRGTKTYKNEAGDKKIVRVVKLLSKKESEAADAERALLLIEHPMRAWTSKDGKHKIEARFVQFAAGKVHLVNKAGKSITIAPNNLSIADREYYRNLVKKAREEARKKAKEEDDADELEPFAGER